VDGVNVLVQQHEQIMEIRWEWIPIKKITAELKETYPAAISKGEWFQC
jgi:hypothetical protein